MRNLLISRALLQGCTLNQKRISAIWASQKQVVNRQNKKWFKTNSFMCTLLDILIPYTSFLSCQWLHRTGTATHRNRLTVSFLSKRILVSIWSSIWGKSAYGFRGGREQAKAMNTSLNLSYGPSFVHTHTHTHKRTHTLARMHTHKRTHIQTHACTHKQIKTLIKHESE